ncbi:VOC family protein [Streptomyces sp. NBC_00878]|uniref:VOC family protein n=1 Tax=Streptomyces sp. NBC_00878 TaxID=2975854 RepID=UPI00225227D8|nr:VOC family protein [Streptomyces sp. NBC_00878]MCX4906433.1 VOC family protein [Streptomyces sp. NBC_00878]
MAGSEASADFADFVEGVPCWIDAQLPDVEAGKRFYGELFGWTFEPFEAPEAPEAPGAPGAPEAPESAESVDLSGKTEASAGPSPASQPSPGSQAPQPSPGSQSPQPSPGSPEPPSPSAHATPAVPPADAPPVALTPYTPPVRPTPYADALRARLDGAPVAALVPKRDGRMPTVWTVYFATPDADALAGRIRAAGGQVITTPVPVGPYGRIALAADSESAVFGLWEGGTHPGFGRRHGPGSFSWVELYARNTAVADSFYTRLFHDALFGPGTTRDFGRVLVSEVFPVEMPPHFLVHFGVEDCEAVLGAVVRLGGRVQATPFDTSYGRVAVVTDNQGASFALLQA